MSGTGFSLWGLVLEDAEVGLAPAQRKRGLVLAGTNPPRLKPVLLAALIFLPVCTWCGPPQSTPSEKSQRLPQPVPLGRGPALQRGAVTGELHAAGPNSPGSATPGAI